MHLRAREVCEKTVENEPERLELVQDHFKTQDMCERAVEKGLYNAIFVPDWFAMQGQVKLWYDHNYYCDDDELI